MSIRKQGSLGALSESASYRVPKLFSIAYVESAFKKNWTILHGTI